MINFVLVALSFVIVTLYLFAFAYKGFTLIKEREGEVPTESNNEFTIRLERLNEKLKKTQNETQVRIGNIDSRTTTQDTDPKSFFNITNGKLKDRQ